jgi:AraC-like DNA-binding protein
VFGISIEAPPEGFTARISARSAGPLRFAKSESTDYRIARSREDIAKAPADHYSIYLQMSGQTVSVANDHTTVLNANDVALYDGREPFHGMHSGQRAIAVIPRAIIDRRAPWLRQRRSHKLVSNSPFVDLARRHVIALNDSHAVLSDTATMLLTENLCNLVALATVADVPPSRLQPELQIEALLAVCRQHLHEPDLSPQFVADRLGVSIRTLHSRFTQIGETFGRWVLDHRLEACHSALRDENQYGLNISEIAYRWGFNDLSYFNKAFRARFGMTPSECRRELRARSQPAG